MVLCNPLKADFNAGACTDPLGSWVGVPIWDICPFDYGEAAGAGAGENHCAHFVGHALGHVSGQGARCTTLGDWRKVDRVLAAEINIELGPDGVPYKKMPKAEQVRVMKAARSARGALTRCNELYAQCANRTQFIAAGDDPRLSVTATGESLAFAAAPANFESDFSAMKTGAKKHVGIVQRGSVYHYSTVLSRVLQDTVAGFIARKKRDYGTNCLFVVTDLPS